jgi:MFS family permease
MTQDDEAARPIMSEAGGDAAAAAGSPSARRGRPRLSRNVKALAVVSFFTDVASEMIYPLLPLFLSTVIGTSAAGLGVIEGLAESVSSLLRLPAGWWSDRIKRRKPLVLFGYTVAALMRPLIGLAQSTGQVLAIRLGDRFGKGVRTAPRDALIADSVLPSQRGYAYGFHRAADSLGAVAGPLVAWALLTLKWVELRELFLWAAVPGLASVVLVTVFVKESRQVVPVAGADLSSAPPETPAGPVAPLGRVFWRFLMVLFLFTLSTSTDAFLLLRASQLGVATALIPILWAMLHVVKSSSTLVGGALSDRLGRRPLILGGWSLYALVYLAFAFASAQWHAWAIFLVYGLYFGMTEGTEKALVADLVPAERRGTAFGWFNAALGLGALPASVVFGVVWQRFGAETAFLMGAALASFAAMLLVLLVPARPVEKG